MKITFLGTGTSQGVPVIACPCDVCSSANQKDNRLRTSIKIEINGQTFVIDSGPDFRQQMLRSHTKQLDALIFTHEHKDHIAGMDDIRAFNYFSQKAIEIYATERVQQALKREFYYVFSDEKYPGIPEVNLNTIKENEPFYIGNIEFTPIQVLHYYLPVLGFRIGDFVYITDANKIEPKEMEKIKGAKVLVLNALRIQKHISHFTLDEAIEIARKVGAQQTYLTHISHQLGLHDIVQKELPEGIHLAHDGLELMIS
ncbi:MAG: MBL fold metallo-hydrolase [Bacteroidia bacterium]|nr:MBL fold metallo-hydrolase [Bacteroidia bacterium]MCO5252839.1 MBL fold metallo-hydrolase [Bacteroidota bacterium]